MQLLLGRPPGQHSGPGGSEFGREPAVDARPRGTRPRNNKPAFQLGLRGSGICWEAVMNGLIYLIGLIVVILAILSFFGLR